MARIVLNTFGSFGDLHPYLAVALELKQRGHTPVIATSEVYRAKVDALGLSFAPVRPDVGELIDDQQFLEKLWHPRSGTRYLVREYLLPSVDASYEDLLGICRGADLLLTHAISYAGPLVAEKLRLRWLSVALQPLLFLSAQDQPALSPLPFLHRLKPGPAVYRALFAFSRRLSRPWGKPIHDLRRRAGLPPFNGSVFFDATFSPYGTLACFSKHFAQPQLDWPRNVTVCGFPFFDQLGPEDCDLSSLHDFLNNGEPPLLFTLGSSASLQAGSFSRKLARRSKLKMARCAARRQKRCEGAPTVRSVQCPCGGLRPLFGNHAALCRNYSPGRNRHNRPSAAFRPAYDRCSLVSRSA